MSENSFGAGEIFRLLYENRGRQPIYQPEAENYPSLIMATYKIILLIL